MSIAEDLDAFLRFAPRKPVDSSLDRKRDMEDSGFLRKIPAQLLDEDSAAVFDSGLPASLLREAALRDTLPPFASQSVLRAAWTRSVLLGQHDGAKQLTPAMKATYPAAKALLEHYASEADPDAMRFTAAYLMLRYPSLDREVVEGYDAGRCWA